MSGTTGGTIMRAAAAIMPPVHLHALEEGHAADRERIAVTPVLRPKPHSADKLLILRL